MSNHLRVLHLYNMIGRRTSCITTGTTGMSNDKDLILILHNIFDCKVIVDSSSLSMKGNERKKFGIVHLLQGYTCFIGDILFRLFHIIFRFNNHQSSMFNLPGFFARLWLSKLNRFKL